MAKYNHVFDVAFSVISDAENGEDVTEAMLISALRKRADDLERNSEAVEACGAPFDTYLID